MPQPGKLFIVAAPSGTGKTTVVEKAIEILSKKIPIKRVITYTTRAKRKGEVDGVDYNFIDKTSFLKKVASNFFLEVSNYSSNCYGSPRHFIDDMKKGKSFIMITDRHGAISLKKIVPDSIGIWLMPPSIQELERRLTQRGTEDSLEIKRRIDIALKEMLLEKQEPIFSIRITNDIFDDTVAQICSHIKKSLKT